VLLAASRFMSLLVLTALEQGGVKGGAGQLPSSGLGPQLAAHGWAAMNARAEWR
jgi:hypothetical protein